MTFNANKLPNNGASKFKRDPLDPGAYPARVVKLVTLGIQKERPFKGEEKAPRQKLRITYELLDEFLLGEDGEPDTTKPIWIEEEIAFLSLKADRALSTLRYYALDPEEKYKGDFSRLLGVPCMVTVTVDKSKDGKFYENVASVSSMTAKQAQKAPELVNKPVLFDFYDPDINVFNSFPEWFQKRLTDAVDFDGSKLHKLLGEDYVVNKEKEEPENEKATEEDEDW